MRPLKFSARAGRDEQQTMASNSLRSLWINHREERISSHYLIRCLLKIMKRCCDREVTKDQGNYGHSSVATRA